jgi:AcrR family transcriptional regulator
MAAPAGTQGQKRLKDENMSAQSERTAPVAAEPDSSKRRQIIAGARQVFMAQGFDAASMGEIARAAGVSKGTLYVYFANKDELFEAIVGQECRAQAEHIFELDPANHDVEGVLTRLGVDFTRFLCRPGGSSPLRTVIAIAERMPEVGRHFYQTGPGFGIAQLEAYLRAQVAAGVLAVEDCEVAAAQFIDACLATVFKPILFNFGESPAPERIEHVVRIAVRTFMAAYRAG